MQALSDGVDQPTQCEDVRCTLYAVLEVGRQLLPSPETGQLPSATLSQKLPALWGFAVFLRCGPGCDGQYIKNHRNTKKTSRKLNWHQSMEHELAAVNQVQCLPRSRTSRLHGWMLVAGKARDQFNTLAIGGVPLGVPEFFQTGMLVMVLPPSKHASYAGWQVGLVKSVWRTHGKKQKLCIRPVPAVLSHTIRVVILENKVFVFFYSALPSFSAPPWSIAGPYSTQLRTTLVPMDSERWSPHCTDVFVFKGGLSIHRHLACFARNVDRNFGFFDWHCVGPPFSVNLLERDMN